MGNVVTMFNCVPVLLVSVYTTLTADGLCHIPWPLRLSIWLSQNSSSYLASLEMGKNWHQNSRVLRTVYMLLVMRRETVPIAKDIDIILPITLASVLAITEVSSRTCCNWAFRATIFSPGMETRPASRSRLKPNHVTCCTGSS